MILYFLLKGKKAPLLYCYVLCQLLIFIWSAGQIVEISSFDFQSQWFSLKLEYLAICFVGLAWLIFCFAFTNHKIIKLKRYALLLFIFPLLFYILLLTNKNHHLFYTVFKYNDWVRGPVFWLNILELYTYLIIGTIFLIRYSFRNIGETRKQNLLLVLAVLFPVTANVIKLLNIIFGTDILGRIRDITPVSFAFSLLFFAIATFRYRFLNIVPIAYRRIVNNMSEAVVVIDNSNKINKFNLAFKDNFLTSLKIKAFTDIHVFIKELGSKVESSEEAENIFKAIETGVFDHVNGGLDIISPIIEYYSVNVQPIYNRKREILGRIVTFNNITEYKNLLKELDVKNNKLMEMNSELKEYSDTVEELTIIKTSHIQMVWFSSTNYCSHQDNIYNPCRSRYNSKNTGAFYTGDNNLCHILY